MTCTGTGSPSVVLDAGGGDSSSIWDQIQPEVAKMTQACAYDRADSGYSDTRPSAGATTALLNATELHALLRAADIAGPYVFVGHSYAAVLDQVYAGQYPADMAGLVLVDPLAGLYFKGEAGFYEDVIDFDASRQQVEASSLPNVPLIVLTGQGGPYGGPQSLAAHRAIAARSPQGKQVIVPNSGHRIHRDQPDAVIAAIREVVEGARMASPDDNQQPDPMTTPSAPESRDGKSRITTAADAQIALQPRHRRYRHGCRHGADRYGHPPVTRPWWPACTVHALHRDPGLRQTS